MSSIQKSFKRKVEESEEEMPSQQENKINFIEEKINYDTDEDKNVKESKEQKNDYNNSQNFDKEHDNYSYNKPKKNYYEQEKRKEKGKKYVEYVPKDDSDYKEKKFKYDYPEKNDKTEKYIKNDRFRKNDTYDKQEKHDEKYEKSEFLPKKNVSHYKKHQDNFEIIYVPKKEEDSLNKGLKNMKVSDIPNIKEFHPNDQNSKLKHLKLNKNAQNFDMSNKQIFENLSPNQFTGYQPPLPTQNIIIPTQNIIIPNIVPPYQPYNYQPPIYQQQFYQNPMSFPQNYQNQGDYQYESNMNYQNNYYP